MRRSIVRMVGGCDEREVGEFCGSDDRYKHSSSYMLCSKTTKRGGPLILSKPGIRTVGQTKIGRLSVVPDLLRLRLFLMRRRGACSLLELLSLLV